jgi:hypothetical protein
MKRQKSAEISGLCRNNEYQCIIAHFYTKLCIFHFSMRKNRKLAGKGAYLYRAKKCVQNIKNQGA